MNERPFELGWKAGLAGDDPRLCPFDKLTAEWYEWQSWRTFACGLLENGHAPIPPVAPSTEGKER